MKCRPLDLKDRLMQEDTMKRSMMFSIVCIALTGLPSGSFAQTSEDANDYISVFGDLSSYRSVSLGRFERQYFLSLDSPVEAIVEGTLREIARIKLCQPLTSSVLLEEKLNSLAIHGTTPGIRYKAALTRLVFEYPELFGQEADTAFRTPEDMFAAISSRLNQMLLATSQEVEH